MVAMGNAKTRGTPSGTRIFSLVDVLNEELSQLRPGSFQPRQAQTGEEKAAAAPPPYSTKNDPEERQRAANTLRDVYTRIHELGVKGTVALCLSGGGIRSATFNLGVLQALAGRQMLGRFDYLSSVSGGGFISGWLSAWIYRCGSLLQVETALSSLSRPASSNPQPLEPEPEPLDNLRDFSNYLTPKTGILSLDSWGVAAILVRNLLLNWLVMLPIIAAAISVPRLGLLVVQGRSFLTDGMDSAKQWSLIVAFCLAFVASLATHIVRRFPAGRSLSAAAVGRWVILPLVVACVALAYAGVAFSEQPCTSTLWVLAFAWCLGIPFLGWAISEILARFFSRRAEGEGWIEERPPTDGLAILVSGLLPATLLCAAVLYIFPIPIQRAGVYFLGAVPTLLLLYLLGRTLFVALSSRMAESDRSVVQDEEWWARLSGLVLLLALAWAFSSALVIFSERWVGDVGLVGAKTFAAVGGFTGLASVVFTRLTTSSPVAPAKQSTLSKLQPLLLSVAAPVFCICLLLLLAEGTRRLGEMLSDATFTTDFGPQSYPLRQLFYLGGVLLGLAAFSGLMQLVVDVNRYSLHGLYRNRLVRAYLGASHVGRTPNSFTGLDVDDDLRLHQLWSPSAAAKKPGERAPLPVLGVTLNLTSGTKLAWQQRKAESFSMSPLFCGNFYQGYRRSRDYGGPNGISLGTAMAVSGAAANPNMGSYTSGALRFLMGLLNVRLGVWLGNPGTPGDKVFDQHGPRRALVPLFAELFGWTRPQDAYVNLSDGGHFDNLGLYEMVLRRCRLIVVSDAGRDPTPTYGDLGNAIRKIRIDFGIPIVFTQKLVLPSAAGDGKPVLLAKATIGYDSVDGPSAPKGQLLYWKPVLLAASPYDVTSYQSTAPDFPNESTADQWFSEAQFESYRALGEALIEAVQSQLEAELAPLGPS
jgi:Patatin-like phospholipase